MKRYIYFLVLVSLICFGCQEYIPQDHYVSVIIDRSEIESYAPEAEDVITYVTHADATDAITLSLSYISDTQYGSKYSFVLGKAQVGWLSNEDKRRKIRRAFFKQFKDSLYYCNQQHKPLQRSDIFRVVARELNGISEQGSRAEVLLFSDLKEHSSLFSVYNPRHRQQLLQNTDALMAEYIMSTVKLPKNLTGVTLRIIYKPSIEDAPIFTAMVSIYTDIIESRGGKVVVGRHTKLRV